MGVAGKKQQDFSQQQKNMDTQNLGEGNSLQTWQFFGICVRFLECTFRLSNSQLNIRQPSRITTIASWQQLVSQGL